MNKKYLSALALALAAVSSMAVAMRSNEVEFEYLDTKGDVVGGKTYHCAGGISEWGKQTTEFVKYSSPCN